MPFTPSTLAALPAERLCGLTLITGGEVCTAELVDRYAAVATLVNEYGPDRDDGGRHDRTPG